MPTAPALLARLPLAMAIRESSDAGTPPAAGNGLEAAAFEALAGAVRGWLGARQETPDAA